MAKNQEEIVEPQEEEAPVEEVASEEAAPETEESEEEAVSTDSPLARRAPDGGLIIN